GRRPAPLRRRGFAARAGHARPCAGDVHPRDAGVARPRRGRARRGAVVLRAEPEPRMTAQPGDMNDLPLIELFRMEAEGQLAVLTEGLLALERGDTSQLEALMRAAHSLKGAARIVGLDTAVRVAHAMEDC